MSVERKSGCKVNLLLNILGERPDGFHELETIMHPVSLWDHLSLSRAGCGIELTCTLPELPTDANNLVYRAAASFFEATQIREGVRIHLEKRLPVAAGLGGGSGNAAATLLALNELFGHVADPDQLYRLAASLGSDVPFFLQSSPALASGRGEKILPLEPFAALRGACFLLVYPGFGVSTAWAYQQLGRFPQALQGDRGRTTDLLGKLKTGNLATAGAAFYNALELPVLGKYPLLAMFQEYLRQEGAPAVLLSGSGSTTYAVLPSRAEAEGLEEKMKRRFGPIWTAVVPVL